MIKRIVIGPRGKKTKVYKIFNLEFADGQTINEETLFGLFYDPLIEEVVTNMSKKGFLEVMYHNGVIDPAQEAIVKMCAQKGVPVEAARVGHRYYGVERFKVFVNKKVHIAYTREPELETLKPRGLRKGMVLFDLRKMSDDELVKLSKDRELSMSLEKMKKLAQFQEQDKHDFVTDVYLETFGARWSDHCNHEKWKALGLFKLLKDATKKIANPNLVSAFVDNAGGWKFYGKLVSVLKLETHNSPTQQEPYGGQLTKLGGVIRDIFNYGLGALAIGNLEMTVVGEFFLKKYRWLKGRTLSAKIIAQETIRAIADYGNPMGIPMQLARMFSHPAFGGKTFALGGTVGITDMDNAIKGKGLPGDYVVLYGGDTGNDGLHGATVSSGEITEKTDTGDACHVQIGNPYEEQKAMRLVIELRDAKCIRAKNDNGAAGLVSSIGELGEVANGVLFNLALVPLKCLGLENWQIATSESQERNVDIIKRDKLAEAKAIYAKYGVKATVIGLITGNGRMQIVYDKDLTEFDAITPLSGEICLDVPYSYFDECPLPKIEVISPPEKEKKIVTTKITVENVEEMAEMVIAHFDVCNQAYATTQYDSTVQGKTFQGPLYGVNYNIASMLAVLKPEYGKQWGLTLSQSFSPWQFEADPVTAAENALIDAVVTQVIAGVKLEDICLADNFYTPNKDPYAYWHLSNQVRSLAELSLEFGTPFITGKDSSSGSATFDDGKYLINVLASVCITAMGKIKDARMLKLHQWTESGNYIYVVGPQVTDINGSILASALDLSSDGLTAKMSIRKKKYIERVSAIGRSDMVLSAVPINRGGIILRLFEGMEASGFGFKTNLCQELFPETFGTVLVEVAPENALKFQDKFAHTPIAFVGKITKEKHLYIQKRMLDFDRLFKSWNTTFEREVLQ